MFCAKLLIPPGFRCVVYVQLVATTDASLAKNAGIHHVQLDARQIVDLLLEPVQKVLIVLVVSPLARAMDHVRRRRVSACVTLDTPGWLVICAHQTD